MSFSPEEFINLVKKTYDLIIAEVDKALKEAETDPNSEYLSVMYPKIVVMSQFLAFFEGKRFKILGL